MNNAPSPSCLLLFLRPRSGALVRALATLERRGFDIVGLSLDRDAQRQVCHVRVAAWTRDPSLDLVAAQLRRDIDVLDVRLE